MFFLNNSDRVGMAEAFDVLVKTKKGQRRENVGHAYEIALRLGDESRLQEARETMVSLSPEGAIRNFVDREGNDEKGLDYALGVIASSQGVDQKTLREVVEKYQR